MNHPLIFSTLACPQWSIETIIANAVAFGYDGIEWRGGPLGHVNPSFSARERVALHQATRDAGLMALGVTTYTSFVSEDVNDQEASIDELRRYADLAADIGAKHVRAFLGELPPGTQPDQSMMDRMAASLQTAAGYAEKLGVRIVVEPHDDFARSSSVVPILRQVEGPALGVIWDVGNTYAAGEEFHEGFALLRERLAYLHIKDGRGRADTWQLGLVGEGDVPLADIFGLLADNGFTGALCVEWEWAWHPELDPPDIALPHAAQTIRSLLAAVQSDSSTIYS